jgi:cobyrinic acid a,c-diamide synthase
MPRLVVAGLSGESGKTLVSLALLLEARRREVPVRAFKKGPDYIDAAWLRWASGSPARNLDTYLMGFESASRSFGWNGVVQGINIVEGNRGLFDGLDANGTHSSAELAKALQAPVVLVLNATKVTRTAAALVLGCQRLDPDLRIAGVILNQVAGARHERVIRQAIESVCRVPVLGAIPRAPEGALLPERHLGLVPPVEYAGCDALARNVMERVSRYLDFERLLRIAESAPALPPPAPAASLGASASGLTVGYISDSAFSFYYPENLEALQAAGAGLVAISALSSPRLPENLDALYVGGGFPVNHADALAGNRDFLASLRDAARSGLPVYAECGGLMLLSQSLTWKGRKHRMAGVLPFEVEVCNTPQGHGYTELEVDVVNPFFPPGTRLRGHEFHYSKVVLLGEIPATACAVVRGTGCFTGRDAAVTANTWAAYTHLHALATPEWAQGMLNAARSARVAG